MSLWKGTITIKLQQTMNTHIEMIVVDQKANNIKKKLNWIKNYTLQRVDTLSETALNLSYIN